MNPARQRPGRASPGCSFILHPSSFILSERTMADITPQAPRQDAQEAQGVQDALPAFPEAPPALPTSEPDGAYQELSLAALGGFALAVFTAAYVLLGGLLPMWGDRPVVFWLTLVLAPLLAVAGTAASPARRNSETLSWAAGIALLAWATALGLVGLITSAGTRPWNPLGMWFWLIPVTALILCLVARV